MGNCCQTASSMEWDGEDWSSFKSIKNTRKSNITTRSNKVFDHEGNDHGLSLGEVQKEKLSGTLQRQRASPDMDGKVKLRISKKELAELLLGSGILENNNQIQEGRASAEHVLLRLINRANANKPHGPWKPMLDCIPESPN